MEAAKRRTPSDGRYLANSQERRLTRTILADQQRDGPKRHILRLKKAANSFEL